ncbi:hypothetical protein N7447_006803, partial [Penicillium robsamsonii]|uniref:uncharacterized protein n=1 Tax=Penicillium robsamsonii TaxID=1792511 RepID=UPI0025470DDC
CLHFTNNLTRMMSAFPKEKIQASAFLKDPTHIKQVKDLRDDNSSESIETVATKKRKRGDRPGAKRLRISSSMETMSPGSIHSKTSKSSKTSRKSSRKSSGKKESKRDDSVTKSAMSREILRSTPPESTLREPTPKPSGQQISKVAASTKPMNPFELPDLSASEYIVPRELELGLGIFDCSSERETSYEPVSEYLPEQHNEAPTPYTPVLRGVSQYNERIQRQCGGVCETWLARQMYDELDDISTRIEDIMRGIRVMLEQKGAMDDCDEFNGLNYHFGESPGAFEGGPENPFELSDGEDNELFVADERAHPGESGVVSGDE